MKAIGGQPDYARGSVHAIICDGTLVIASATGSQLAPYTWRAANVIFVADAQKLVPTLQAAHERIYQVVLELAAETGLGCTVGDFSLAQLYAVDEVFVTGTMDGLVPVLTIDRRQIGSTRPGPVTALLTKAFADLTATTGTPVC
jgi:hypothetical protein